VQPLCFMWPAKIVIERQPEADQGCPARQVLELVLPPGSSFQRAHPAAGARHWPVVGGLSRFSGDRLHLVLECIPNGRSRRCGRCWP